MKNYKMGIVAVALSLLLSACASGPGHSGWYDDWAACASAGAAAGIAGGATDDFDSAMAGAVGGFIVGGLICANSDTDADGVKNRKDDCPGTVGGAIVDQNGCEMDSDGDGVVDRLDECPGTPAGTRVNEVGCPFDADGDGVADARDRCPGTPAGAKVDEHGCELDSDSDGVVDSQDKCPNTQANTPVDNTGCVLAAEFKLEGVNFEFDSAKLTADSTAKLDDALKILKRHGDLKVEVAGHTDSVGSDVYNQGLSQRRAQAVADYLIGKGANADNITVKGYGESRPVADNATEAGRAANRRVEFRH
ncbi:MAG: OmpA family protein [Xanthomonadales bacterium]|nr:OmpA family protein [Xanthomonadales bacterium]